MSELQGSLQKLRQRQEELTEKWNRYRELLLTVEKEINKNLGDEDAPIYCNPGRRGALDLGSLDRGREETAGGPAIKIRSDRGGRS